MIDVKQAKITIEGISPGLIMSNGRMADPSCEYAQRLHQLNQNKMNPSEINKLKHNVEMQGFSYVNEEGQPVIPIENLHAAIARGATRYNKIKGRGFFAGILVTEHSVLDYDGPDTIDELISDDRFCLRIPVVIAKSRVIKSRPHFKKWSATINVEYEEDLMDIDILLNIFKNTGRFIGLGDWRPSAPKAGKYGRFFVKDSEVLN